MIHTLTNSLGVEDTLENYPVMLFPPYTLVVPALCTGVIPHTMTLRSGGEGDSWVMLVSEPGVLFTEGLLVISGPVNDGPITTVVFNLTNREKRLAKGTCVSRLIKVPGATWNKV